MLTKPHSMAGLAVTALGLATAAVAIKSTLHASADRAIPSPGRETAAKQLNVAAALLAASALTDSATGHYRGEFHNPIMILPLAVASQALGASVLGAVAPTGRLNSTRDLGYALALATGIAGTGFHFYNIVKRPGGWSWLNLFYAAPLGAPIALSLSGVLGSLAERPRCNESVVDEKPGRLIARLVAVGLVGASGEAALMHFLKIVGEIMPDERNRVTLADETDEYGLPIARVTFSYGDNDKRLIRHSLRAMRGCLDAGGARDLWDEEDDTCHLNGTARMGDDPRTSVVNADCRSWDVRNLWICDGSVFPTVGGVNPSLTIQAIALRTADRIRDLASRGEL